VNKDLYISGKGKREGNT